MGIVMSLYHYCILSNLTKIKGITYTSGSIKMDRQLRNNKEYEELVDRLAKMINKDRKDIIVISLNKIG